MLTQKTLITTILLVLISFLNVVKGQSVNVTTTVTPPYPIHIEDVISFNFGTIVTLNNFSNESLTLKLVASLEGDNGVSVIIKESFIPALPVQLSPNGTRLLSRGDLRRLFSNITENDIIYNGVSRSTLMQTEKLPEGHYQLCIKALDYNTGELMSSESSGCASIFITDYDPPIITYPTTGEYITPKNTQAIMLSWTPSGLAQYTKYKVEIVDMTLNNLMNPNDAFGNISIILHYQKSNILQTSMFYDASKPKLFDGHEYAMRVTAYDPTNSLNYKNNGHSEVVSFKYKKHGGIDIDKDIEISNGNNVQFGMNVCQNQSPPNDQQAVTDVNEYDVLKIGDHDLKVFDISWNGNKLTGQGKIVDSYFKVPILVEFENLKVNAAHEVFDGIAKARADNNIPTEWINELGDVDFQGDDITNTIQDLLNGNNDRIIEYPYSNLDSVGLGMPIGINRKVAGADQVLAIVGMQFSPLGAGLNVIGDFQFPKFNQNLTVAASGVCFEKSGFTKDAFLYLVEDVTLNQNKKFKVKFDKGVIADPPEGTYIIMESKGFKEAQINGEFQIDKTLITPVDKDLDQVIIEFDALVDNPRNFILDNVDITPFEITKFPGFEVTVTNFSYDHSETKNPDNIVFPTENYNGNEGNLWQGFYLKTSTIKLPEKLHKNSVVNATNFVIDKQGFSGIIETANVFDTEQGKLGTKKWKWSMENLYVKIIANNLDIASFDGDIRVPITKDDYFMSYSTVMSKLDDKLLYNFTLINEEEIHFPAIIAKGEISPQTRIEIIDDGEGFEPEFHLFGHLTLNKNFVFNAEDDGFLPSITLDSVTVEDLIISNEGLLLGPDGAVSFSYDADQRKFHGFDINIDTVKVKPNKIFFGVSVDLLGETNAVSAEGGFDILVDYGDEDNNMMRFKGLKLKELTVDGDISVAKINGSIKILDDPEWGTGFDGQLSIALRLGADEDAAPIEAGKREEGSEEVSDVGISIHTIFGNMPSKGNVDAYKYFYFMGEFFLKQGLPLTASLNIYGLKGGIYLNMTQEEGADIYSIPKPHKSANNDTNFGLVAGLDIGLKDAHAFHAKPQLFVQFGTKSGLQKLSIVGQAYVMTKWLPTFEPYPEGASPISIEMDATLDFENKLFTFDSEISVLYPLQSKKPMISAFGSANMMVDNASKKWFIKVGVPTAIQEQDAQPNIGVNVANLFTKQHYFMAGTDLPKMIPVPQHVLQSLNKPYSSQRGNVQNSSNLKFAFGSQFNFELERLKSWILYAEFDILFGYDVMITKKYNPLCGIGENNWYMRGQAYGKFKADIGIEAKIFGKIRSLKLIYVDVAALVEVGLPKPSGIQAKVKGEADFMGIIKGDFEFEAEHGEICVEANPDHPINFNDLVYIQDCNAKTNDVHVFTEPEVSLLFSAKNRKSYPLTEVKDGEEITRTFRFPIKTAKLYIDDANSKNNGKVIANFGEAGLDGYFNFGDGGDRFKYFSDKSLEANTKYRLKIGVKVMETTSGISKEIKGVKNTTKTFSFKTGDAPTEIVSSNVKEMYPVGGQRYYLQDEHMGNGFIRLKKDQGDLFISDPENPSEVKIRFIPVGLGNIIQGEFIKYEDNVIYFKHDKLVKKKKYVCQIYKKYEGGGMYNDDLPIVNNDFEKKMTVKFKLLNGMHLSDKEAKIYDFVFGVSQYYTLPEKLDHLQLQPSTIYTWLDAETSSGLVKYKASEEGFDIADKKHMDARWWLTSYSGYLQMYGQEPSYNYYNNYLKPDIYDFYNKTIKPIVNPNSSGMQLDTRMIMIDPEPLISQAEINSILKNILNMGPQKTLPPSSKIVTFIPQSMNDAHADYNYLKLQLMKPELADYLIKGNMGLFGEIHDWATSNKTFKIINLYKEHRMLMWHKTIEGGTYIHSKTWHMSKRKDN